MSKELYTREEVRELDRVAIEDYKIPGISLMERAGEAAFTVIKNKWPSVKKLIIFCGVGNNGGDGYIVAKLAIEADYEVIVYQLGDINKLKGDALLAYKQASSKGILPIEWDEVSSSKFNNNFLCDDFNSSAIHSTVIVDAICGTGLNAKLTGLWLIAVEAINNAKISVLSIDIPTGLDANTGVPLGEAVYSTVTVTFIGQKQGMYTGKACDYCGEIIFSSLDIPIEVYGHVKYKVIKQSLKDLHNCLPKRKASYNKCDLGKVLVIGGGPGMGGAVRMAAEAALRTGAGLVYVITHPSHANYISMARPELICYGVDNNNIVEVLDEILIKDPIILLGPGLGKLTWSKNIFQTILDLDYKFPMVVDADGLNLLAQNPIKLVNCILTPHPGEAARLLNIKISDIEQDRFKTITKLKEKFASTVVLKGAGSLVTYQDKIGICCLGNASMATAGMGDILAGIIAGLLAQKLNCEDAAACGVCLHSSIGDLVSKQGKYGIIATDLLAKLPGFELRV